MGVFPFPTANSDLVALYTVVCEYTSTDANQINEVSDTIMLKQALL